MAACGMHRPPALQQQAAAEDFVRPSKYSRIRPESMMLVCMMQERHEVMHNDRDGCPNPSCRRYEMAALPVGHVIEEAQHAHSQQDNDEHRTNGQGGG